MKDDPSGFLWRILFDCLENKIVKKKDFFFLDLTVHVYLHL